jgi:hypothetical protein
MKLPSALTQLIDELSAEEVFRDDVEITKQSSLTVYVDDNDEPYNLKASDAELLLQSPDTVRHFFEALRCKEASIEIHDIRLGDTVLDALESTFTAVDEV